jgi:calcium/calmodulin-dependent protein kinase I
VIADFGLATRIKQKRHVFYRCGTPGYVAPEILEYKDGQKMYSEKCDVFSLGVVFY